MPQTLLRAYRIEGETEHGVKVILADEGCNLRQCVNVRVSGRFRKITLIPLSTWAERENGAAHAFDVR